MQRTLRSMTAFGRASATTPIGHLIVEVQSVNRRHLEIALSMPKALHRFEMQVRKWIGESVARGQVALSVMWREEKSRALSVAPNLPLATALMEAWEHIAKRVGSSEKPTLALLAEHEDILLYEEALQEDESLYELALEGVVKEALTALVAMREIEGAALARDLIGRLDTLAAVADKIETKAPQAVEKQRLKLKSRLEELFAGHPENEEKVHREIALLAERLDIAEELLRLRSHLAQCRQLMVHATEPQGKTLEFLVQELLREMNTLGAKSNDATVAGWVIEAKAEIEKMREQIQNVE